MNLGDRIAYFRTEKKLSVNKLANKSGISQSYLRDIELNVKHPTVETLTYICDALDISLLDFFNDSTMQKLDEDPLFKMIYKLNHEQRKLLLDFINSIVE